MGDWELRVQAPGRINIIGEHTDYNEGWVLPAAIDKNTTFYFKKNGTLRRVTIMAGDLSETVIIDLNNLKRLKKSGWENYLIGVLYELQQSGKDISGFDARFSGEVPIGSGMSSSAALECSFACGVNQLFGLGLSSWQIMKVCQRAEHHFAGTQCGIMDQFASIMGKKYHALLLDCRSLDSRYLPLKLESYQFLLLNTNVSHALATSAYNTRRAECEQGVVLIQKQFPHVQSLRDVDKSMLEQVQSLLPKPIMQRCRHVICENERVLQAAEALEKGDWTKLGSLMYLSHRSLQHDYQVSCPELDFLVDNGSPRASVAGGRMMGGGFGGCVIFLIKKSALSPFVKEMSQRYLHQFGRQLTPYAVQTGDGAEC